MSSGFLDGLNVLVTRPQPQADKLARHLSKLGAEPVVMPMVEIEPIYTQSSLPPDSPLSDISQFDKVVVVSIPSAEQTFSLKPANANSADWFTPGLSTAKALSRFGIEASCPETAFTSEALLALPALQNIAGQRILLLKGEGGRDLLENELTIRGGKVSSLELYRRVCPKYASGELEQTVATRKIGAIVATSSQIVTHLLHNMKSENTGDLLYNVPLLVPSARVADYARTQGFQNVIICESAGNQDISNALLQLVKQE
ncbi:uroporphyrinogen-III synthase [Sansalvadorimonas sp. 2012CJ34-2]|uniref:Uroporphyrinogen-III synthase n=1 Tax=Parendozoicomonas callyspongiae TaxID=2942213 RepID=A0ABT0PAM1_9GAMM|nr:uroporphyrinogen-III synthase [Sansalvadorimonas sp. 2012CJ34-2]MCL6268375.1 uroporphyrinogen-III synthase [Sansalvadorimonas sp. 2012CJ34-2]